MNRPDLYHHYLDHYKNAVRWRGAILGAWALSQFACAHLFYLWYRLDEDSDWMVPALAALIGFALWLCQRPLTDRIETSRNALAKLEDEVIPPEQPRLFAPRQPRRFFARSPRFWINCTLICMTAALLFFAVHLATNDGQLRPTRHRVPVGLPR